ncbi:MAG TPA: sulfide/dihydroorotate dehydrogenase-like FAD/NAD-binding protein [Chloroflexi bacterium]|nr:MAG: sulfide/dihydroorotate dehydrogenase-like FAD/NAD-binding protein [Chloroflexota bacterium]HDD56033.1 sulfide/dihydroorotate dehydrogenase-like FAD/NAD-binding protein [Chloroflexota bacterium]
MHKITRKRVLAPKITRFSVEAPEVARARKPGQFVVIRADETSERVPLTIVDSDLEKGTIDLIIQDAGFSTHVLSGYEEGDELTDVLGPLGKPTHMDNFGTVVCVGGGVGTAVLYPIVKGLKEAGNTVITINGARNKELLILEEELGAVSDELIITTDDGSYGIKGFGSTVLQGLIDEGKKIDFVVAIGPTMMMKAVAEVTRPYEIPTIASLNAIMIDGTGMCGGCRVTVGDEVKFACVDGPEFDAHLVDFDEQIAKHHYYDTEQACQMEKIIADAEQERS